MYTDIVGYQIVIALLKKYGIRHLVLSAGNRHTPFVRSVEEDGFFQCYSVVDERSASFFALGLIKELKEPVVICCTSGTSVSNYVSCVSEAFYSQLPLVVVTSDRNNYYLNQQEEQSVPQANIFSGICRKSVNLPLVESDKDFWYASRVVNEALLELDHHGKGPVHINVPVEEHIFDFTTEQLPEVTKIDRVDLWDEMKWREKAAQLAKAQRILISYGQSDSADAATVANVEKIAKRYNAVFMVDHISNLHGYGCVHTYNALRVRQKQVRETLMPDLVISLNGNAVEIRQWLAVCKGPFRYWNVREDGMVSDPFRCLTDLFECSAEQFLERMARYAPEQEAANPYLSQWQALCDSITLPEFAYSDIYAVGEFMKQLPKGALLHLGNSNSVRLPQHFPLDTSVTVMCNRGVNGIDGSVSTFIGQACIHKGLAFLLIGDLSFFYDMNGLWNRYVGPNVRILLNNNGCGEIFYGNKRQNQETVGRYIAADHNTSARGWAEATGFKYLSARTKEEFDENLPKLMAEERDKPILLEVFTNKSRNIEEQNKLIEENVEKNLKTSIKNTIKTIIGR